MNITFIGALHEVTGSCTLLEVNGKNYLVDCGMEQGRDIFENVPIPVSMGEIEGVFLTHAHIDHSGMLPKLYKDGYRGPIYATGATCDLCAIMLVDSAHIQESEAEWKNRKSRRAGEDSVEPVYTTEDAEGAISLFRRLSYNERKTVNDGVDVCFVDAGHLLGSASIELWLTEGGETRKIVFSGDIGNTDQPIIRDPTYITEADYVVMESTYGDRLHTELDNPLNPVTELATIIQRTLDRGGSVIIPSFAVGRTQEILFAIREIKERGWVHGHDGFKVYVDSPLATEATGIFLQCDPSYFDDDMLAVLRRGINPIWFDGIELSTSLEDSKAINLNPEPKVIISASGMCDAGRIRHHLKHNLWKAQNTVLFVGYQSEGTLGRALQDGAKTVNLFNEKIAVNAEICSLHGTSGHADKDGLIRWITAFEKRPQIVFINHGDDEACLSFRDVLRSEYGLQAEAPYSGTQFDLLTGHMTVYTEGKRIERKSIPGGDARAVAAYNIVPRAGEQGSCKVHFPDPQLDRQMAVSCPTKKIAPICFYVLYCLMEKANNIDTGG